MRYVDAQAHLFVVCEIIHKQSGKQTSPAGSEDEQPTLRNSFRITDIRPVCVLEIPLRHAPNVCAGYGAQLGHKPLPRRVVATIELSTGKKVSLRGRCLVVQKVFRDELLYDRPRNSVWISDCCSARISPAINLSTESGSVVVT